MKARSLSTVAVIAALVAFAALATGAVLFIAGDAELERLGLLFAFLGTIVPTVVASLRADQAAGQTNGSMDQRISDAVQHALKVRRHGDSALVTGGPEHPQPPDPDPLTVSPDELRR